jgi:hypothetical protein
LDGKVVRAAMRGASVLVFSSLLVSVAFSLLRLVAARDMGFKIMLVAA